MGEATGSLVALDGKLWRTLRALVTQPGFLTEEYLRGRRKFYVRPTRLFLVMSLLMFAVLRLTTEPLRIDDSSAPVDRRADAAKRTTISAGNSDISFGSGLTLGLDPDFNISVKGARNIVTDPIRNRVEHFNRLPPSEKGEQITAGLLRYGPYAMFLLLPVFAWLQQVSYIGRQRPYPGRPKRYIEHLVYATHLHCAMFLAAMVALLIPYGWLRWPILAWVIYYVLRGKHRIYGGSRLGGLVRTLFVAAGYTIFMAIALVLLIFPAILLA